MIASGSNATDYFDNTTYARLTIRHVRVRYVSDEGAELGAYSDRPKAKPLDFGRCQPPTLRPAVPPVVPELRWMARCLARR